MNPEKLKISETTDGKPPREGYEHASAPAPIDSQTGQHLAYWVLSEEERKKGFIRPLRWTYRHVGRSVCGRIKSPLGDPTHLTICASQPNHKGECWGVIQEVSQFEAVWAERFQIIGGCNYNTTMQQALAETFAANPKYYGATFCGNCLAYFPVSEFVWVDDPGTGKPMKERVGT